MCHRIREEDSEEKEPLGGKTSPFRVLFVGSYGYFNDGNWRGGAEGHLKGARRCR